MWCLCDGEIKIGSFCILFRVVSGKIGVGLQESGFRHTTTFAAKVCTFICSDVKHKLHIRPHFLFGQSYVSISDPHIPPWGTSRKRRRFINSETSSVAVKSILHMGLLGSIKEGRIGFFEMLSVWVYLKSQPSSSAFWLISAGPSSTTRFFSVTVPDIGLHTWWECVIHKTAGSK